MQDLKNVKVNHPPPKRLPVVPTSLSTMADTRAFLTGTPARGPEDTLALPLLARVVVIAVPLTLAQLARSLSTVS